ncbi:TPA: type II secretion system protein GspE [candidate division WWE3 bacterium]|uniref:Type II secretion system protein E n=4 Tax=Katanobacteria TaxID=422282 RepID=A0A0G1MUD7_UNCKA|nr:MAG: Type II secretion system protein E [candidate division WWE3 bacterium GW2011_GWC2_44_9]HAZ29558.1 type II secretion system protein GspE [candidate division WWE3 bacterium]
MYLPMFADPLQSKKSLEDYLFEKGLLDAAKLQRIKDDIVKGSGSVGGAILKSGLVNDETYAKSYSEFYDVPYISLIEKNFTEELLNTIPLQLAKSYTAIPFLLDKDTKTLHVAMLDPLDLQFISFLEKKVGYKILSYISPPSELKKVVDENYGKSIKEEVIAALEEINQTTLKIEESHQTLESLATLKDAPVARIVNTLLETAVKSSASDIHIEPEENAVRVRYRIDGILGEKHTLPKEMQESVVARIKILCNLKIDEKRIPQDGRFKVQVGDTLTDLRVSTLPTVNGEKVVIRLLKDEANVYTFKDLGLTGLSLKRFEESLLRSNGIILVTGPTGSGKTVTLATALSKLNTSKVNIVTLEDPVEIRIKGVNQVQINPAAGLTFASGLRSFLRQDPNIIMVGEVRDDETAELAIHAALTGHLVLSTLHTNSSAGAIPRMIDMGVENFLLASTLNCVLAQRLVRKVCDNCKVAYDAPEELAKDIKNVLSGVTDAQLLLSKDKGMLDAIKSAGLEKMRLYRGVGCNKCGDTGYRGRSGIFEVLHVTENIRRLVLNKAPESEINKLATGEGMLTLLQDGYIKVLTGITTIEEVLRVAMD